MPAGVSTMGRLMETSPLDHAELAKIRRGWWSSPWGSASSVIPKEKRGAIVGVRTFINTEFGGDVRVFYPAMPPRTDNSASSWFSPSLSEMADGYAHFMTGWKQSLRKGTWMFEVISFVIRSAASMISLKNAKLPCTYDNLKPRSGKAPLLLWSHGLSGTGEEHGLLAARLAAEGYVVALVHHTDGSSSKVTTDDGNTIYFKHPDWKNYDPECRQKGAEHRAKEVDSARRMLLTGDAGADLRALCDPDRVAVGGFSFGGATAALVAATMPDHYKCAVLWDGWFHIDIDSINIHRDLPSQAFEKGFSLPTIFIGSEQFTKFKNIHDATERLRGKCREEHESHTPAHSTHMSFADVVWWLPAPLLTRMGFSDKTSPYETYAEIVDLTSSFLQKHCPV